MCTIASNPTSKQSVPTHIDVHPNVGGCLENDTSFGEFLDQDGMATFEVKWQPLSDDDVRGTSVSKVTHAEVTDTDLPCNAIHEECGEILPILLAVGKHCWLET